MAIYDKKNNTLIIADGELNIKTSVSRQEVYRLGYDAGYQDGYEAAGEECKKDASAPLTFEFFDYGDIKWVWRDAPHGIGSKTIQYSKNGGNWVTISSSQYDTPTISVAPGDKLYFRGDNASYTGVYDVYGDHQNLIPVGSYFQTSVKCDVYGNIMSMINSQDYVELDTLEAEYTFYEFFSACTALENAENLILPANVLAKDCYTRMFAGLANLKTVPELPATVLADSCYNGMFRECINLKKAPELPALTMVTRCYAYMFHGCKSLTTAPELPALRLDLACYAHMFVGCKSLNYVKCMSDGQDMFSGNTWFWMIDVSPTGTFVKRAGTTWSTGISAIPVGWTVVDAE